MTACDDCGWQECLTHRLCARELTALADALEDVPATVPVFICVDLSTRPDRVASIKETADGWVLSINPAGPPTTAVVRL